MVPITGEKANVEYPTVLQKEEEAKRIQELQDKQKEDALKDEIAGYEQEFLRRAEENNGKQYPGIEFAVVIKDINKKTGATQTYRQPVVGKSDECMMLCGDGTAQRLAVSATENIWRVAVISEPDTWGNTHPLVPGMEKVLGFLKPGFPLDNIEHILTEGRELLGHTWLGGTDDVSLSMLEEIKSQYEFTLSRPTELANGKPLPNIVQPPPESTPPPSAPPTL